MELKYGWLGENAKSVQKSGRYNKNFFRFRFVEFYQQNFDIRHKRQELYVSTLKGLWRRNENLLFKTAWPYLPLSLFKYIGSLGHKVKAIGQKTPPAKRWTTVLFLMRLE